VYAPGGWGTRHIGFGYCKLHGGASPSGELYRAKLQAFAEAVKLGRVMGVPVNVDPLEAFLHCIRIAAGEVEYGVAEALRVRVRRDHRGRLRLTRLYGA
jgi:hypothetical protein